MNNTEEADGERCLGLPILDASFHHYCYNLSASETRFQCELEYPCEVRQYLHSISDFIAITRFLLSYGTLFIIIIGLFLNWVSFYTLVSSGLSKSGSGIYLQSLAICDCGNLLTNFAVGIGRGHIFSFNRLFMEYEWICRFHAVFVDVFQLISAWIVVSFTVERCLAVWHPILFRNKSRTKRARVVVFSLSVGLTLFSLTKLFLTGFESDSVFEYPPCHSKRYRWQGVAYLRVAFQTLIPTVLVFVFNVLMFWKLRRAKKARKKMTKYKRPKPDAKTEGTQREKKRKPSLIFRPSATAPMLIAVSVTYLVLVLPLGVIQIIELFWNIHKKAPAYPGVGGNIEFAREKYVQWKCDKLLLKYIRSFCFAFYQINFSINFFLYFATGLQFRLHLQHRVMQVFETVGISRNVSSSNRNSLEMSSRTASTTVHSVHHPSSRRSTSKAQLKRDESKSVTLEMQVVQVENNNVENNNNSF